MADMNSKCWNGKYYCTSHQHLSTVYIKHEYLYRFENNHIQYPDIIEANLQLYEWLIRWMSDLWTDWLTDGLIAYIGCFIGWLERWMEWVNKWMDALIYWLRGWLRDPSERAVYTRWGEKDSHLWSGTYTLTGESSFWQGIRFLTRDPHFLTTWRYLWEWPYPPHYLKCNYGPIYRVNLKQEDWLVLGNLPYMESKSLSACYNWFRSGDWMGIGGMKRYMYPDCL